MAGSPAGSSRGGRPRGRSCNAQSPFAGKGLCGERKPGSPGLPIQAICGLKVSGNNAERGEESCGGKRGILQAGEGSASRHCAAFFFPPLPRSSAPVACLALDDSDQMCVASVSRAESLSLILIIVPSQLHRQPAVTGCLFPEATESCLCRSMATFIVRSLVPVGAIIRTVGFS